MDDKDKTEKSVNKASPSKLVSKNDPDARLLLTRHLDRQVFFNVQTTVETTHHLIPNHEVVMTTDKGQLTLVAKQLQ